MTVMMFRTEEIEEERESFISSTSYRGGGGMVATAVMVVEYLISSMSRDLLCKFPDNSAFDFDYTQSSIWSPLVPRHFPSPPNFPSSSSSSTKIQRKLCYDDEMEEETGEGTVLRKLKDNIKRNITTSCMFNHFQMKKKSKNMKKKKNKDKFSPIPSSSIKGVSASITPRKGWAKVLKAASRHFKKTIKKKDSAAAARLMIPSGITFPPTSFY